MLLDHSSPSITKLKVILGRESVHLIWNNSHDWQSQRSGLLAMKFNTSDHQLNRVESHEYLCRQTHTWPHQVSCIPCLTGMDAKWKEQRISLQRYSVPPLTNHLREDLRLGWLTVLSSVYMVEQELAFLISTGEDFTEELLPTWESRALLCLLRPAYVRERPGKKKQQLSSHDSIHLMIIPCFFLEVCWEWGIHCGVYYPISVESDFKTNSKIQCWKSATKVQYIQQPFPSLPPVPSASPFFIIILRAFFDFSRNMVPSLLVKSVTWVETAHKLDPFWENKLTEKWRLFHQYPSTLKNVRCLEYIMLKLTVSRT